MVLGLSKFLVWVNHRRKTRWRTHVANTCRRTQPPMKCTDRLIITCGYAQQSAECRSAAVMLIFKYCIVLYCIVLHCIVLYCIVLYCIVLYCIVLYCIVLYCIVLYCTALHCTALHCIALYCIVLYCIVLYCIVLYCIVLYCIVLYCIGCTYIAQRYIRFLCASHQFSLVIGPVRSSTVTMQLSSLGSIQPCYHHGAGNYSNTQAVTVQPGTHLFLGRESPHAGEVSCPRIQRQTAAAETRTQDLSVQTHRPYSPRHDALHVNGVYILVATPSSAKVRLVYDGKWTNDWKIECSLYRKGTPVLVHGTGTCNNVVSGPVQ